jgi:hypothetical protein
MTPCWIAGLLDCWIPDEDWVSQIWDNGKEGCSILNFNTGISTQCVWQNNYATLQVPTIFYNKKNIRISKTKVKKKAFSFYYVLEAGKPAPTVSSNQAFYQLL